MSINKLILNLKENNEDFEFYPTSKEMIKPIYQRISMKDNILDIGCGTCNLRKYIKEFDKEKDVKYLNDIDLFNQHKLERYPNRPDTWCGKYFVIEKSNILLQKLDKDIIVLGTDFYNTSLIDKKAEIYFCNPPYSDYENWTFEILKNGNCNKAYLIIPERWKNSIKINYILKKFDIKYTVLGSFDFLNAERRARAKVEVIEFDKRETTDYGYYVDLNNFKKNAFDDWFDETFKMRNSEKENKIESEIEREERQNIKKQLVSCKSKGDFLVNLYNSEQQNLFEQFKAICSLDIDTLATIGIKKESIKEAIKQKIKSLKTKYWKIVFDEFEEITGRLTSNTRDDMFKRFQSLQTVDFTLENIYPLILWVIKNANTYYNDQLISFFTDLSSEENIKKYKSNQRIFKDDDFYYTKYRNERKATHYVLDYRIIMTSPFETDYNGDLCGLRYNHKEALQDILTIANNLGFDPQKFPDLPQKFGEKKYIYYQCSNKPFMTYRVYKNGNMHVKFDIEFMKAMNVEVSRLLGWIRNKEDIEKEFPNEMANGAEKYFKTNYTCLGTNAMLLPASKSTV